MDYEAVDKEMSCWLVSCQKNGTIFFLTDEGIATDILSHGRRWRWQDEAEAAATAASQEYAWAGFAWKAVPRATL